MKNSSSYINDTIPKSTLLNRYSIMGRKRHTWSTFFISLSEAISKKIAKSHRENSTNLRGDEVTERRKKQYLNF